MQKQMSLIFPNLIVLLFLSSVGCQRPSPSSTLQINHEQLLSLPAKGLVLYQDEPFTGTGLTFYPSGQKATSIDYVAGKRNGFYRKWFADGQLSFEAPYLAGKKHGEVKSWWRNKQLRSIARFEKGIGEGLQQQWYFSGTKFKEIRLENGKEVGLQQSWRQNGKLYNNYVAKNGRIFGLKRANLCYSLDDEVVQFSK
ncbi:MAG: toxin-antitoxin system YwqK family antitoxin [Bacteroidota bacterium]